MASANADDAALTNRVAATSTPDHRSAGVESHDHADTATSRQRDVSLTLRAGIVGIAVGTLIAFSNLYFGLQTGIINTMPLPSALIGFAILKLVERCIPQPFTPAENVVLVAISGAVGGMPTTAGLVGFIPALEFLVTPQEDGPVEFSKAQLFIWAIGIFPFGVVVAMILKKYFIGAGNLPFPVSTATAAFISLLHGKTMECSSSIHSSSPGSDNQLEAERRDTWRRESSRALLAFIAAGSFTILSYFLPRIKEIPIFGSVAARQWMWYLLVSPAFIGFGIIIPINTILNILFGSVLGWLILSQVSRSHGWAPGPVDDWETGSRGWIIWISLGLILGDSVVNLFWISWRAIIDPSTYHFITSCLSFIRKPHVNSTSPLLPDRMHVQHSYGTNYRSTAVPFGGESEALVRRIKSSDYETKFGPRPKATLTILFILAVALALSATHLVFTSVVPIFAVLLSISLSILLSFATIRSMGETGSTQADSISKFCQFIFAAIIPSSTPGAIIANMAIAGVTEAGTWEAAGLTSDVKTASLLGVSSNAVFLGRMIGAPLGGLITVLAYRLFTNAYTIPSRQFPVPAGYLWLSTTRLAYGRRLPDGVAPFAIAAAALAMVGAALRIALRSYRCRDFIPSGVAVAAGMYLIPPVTLAHVVGGAVRTICANRTRISDDSLLFIASGLVLGESVLELFLLVLESAGLPRAG